MITNQGPDAAQHGAGQFSLFKQTDSTGRNGKQLNVNCFSF